MQVTRESCLHVRIKYNPWISPRGKPGEGLPWHPHLKPSSWPALFTCYRNNVKLSVIDCLAVRSPCRPWYVYDDRWDLYPSADEFLLESVTRAALWNFHVGWRKQEVAACSESERNTRNSESFSVERKNTKVCPSSSESTCETGVQASFKGRGITSLLYPGPSTFSSQRPKFELKMIQILSALIKRSVFLFSRC